MGPRWMMPTYLCELLLNWPKMYTHRIHHTVVRCAGVHVCVYTFATYKVLLPIFSNNQTTINSQSEAGHDHGIHKHKHTCSVQRICHFKKRLNAIMESWKELPLFGLISLISTHTWINAVPAPLILIQLAVRKKIHRIQAILGQTESRLKPVRLILLWLGSMAANNSHAPATDSPPLSPASMKLKYLWFEKFAYAPEEIVIIFSLLNSLLSILKLTLSQFFFYLTANSFISIRKLWRQI